MRKGVLVAAFSFLFTIGSTGVQAQTTGPSPDENPTANTGALKAQIETGGSYSAESGNATRIIPDLHVPGALGVYGLDFVRYFNSLRNDRAPGNLYLNPEPPVLAPDQPSDFGSPGWSHSWSWGASYDVYSQELDQTPVSPLQVINTMMITVTFPDGHATRYKISRNVTCTASLPLCSYNVGPPYSAAEANWPGGEVHDTLERMAEDGSEFWLYRADGGSVHFINDSNWGYQAREVFDPHGLLTTLSYDGYGHLIQVQQDGGRRLTITWNSGVITRVESAGSSATQGVDYTYSWFNGWLTLTSAIYHDEPVPGQTVSSTYTYQTYTPPSGFFYAGPLLSTADDPHFAGPMRSISYTYSGSGCLPTGRPRPGFEPYPGAQYDYFYASPTTIQAEKNLETGTTVSSFTLGCFDGTRTEYNGLGGLRKFFYGRSAGPDPGTQGFHCLGYQLAKLTDFTNVYSLPTDLPFERQNYMAGEPRQIWDGRRILTETVHADGSGFPSEVRHVGSDGSSSTYNRVNPGNSEAQDFSRVPNPHPHWLFSKTDERVKTTTYTRDYRRRVKRIDYDDGSYETFEYDNGVPNGFNQVTAHRLPSGAVEHYSYDSRGLLLQEWNDVDLQPNATIYTYDSFDRVATVSHPWSLVKGAAFSVSLTYNGRHKVIREEYPATNGGANPFKTYEYDAYGNCRFITDELGHRSEYQYDSYRRCISYTEPLNAPGWNGSASVPSRTWNWYYDRYFDGAGMFDASAHTSKQWRVQVEPAYDSAGNRRLSAHKFDYEDRVVEEATGLYEAANGSWNAGPDTEVHHFTYDENGNKSSYTDPQGRLTTYDYDLRNRLWKTNETVNTIPRTTEMLYDEVGNKTRLNFPVEAAGQRTQQWLDYDPFGQAQTFIDERGNTTNILYWWGPMKKLGMVTTHRDKDDGGNEDQTTVFSYDYLGRPAHVWFPDGGYAYGSHEDTTYEFGQVKTWTTRKGQTKTINYDARGREISHTWNDGQTPGVTRTWDDASRMTSVSNIFSTIDYGYDAAGQPLYEGSTIAGSGGRAQTTYNRYADGAVSRIIYPNTLSVRHDYTARGQLAATGWSDSNNNWLIQFATYNYLADGKVDHQDYANGMHTAFLYDGRGFINQETVSRNGQTYSQRTVYRDERDRITAFQKGTDNSANPMENGNGDRFRYDEEGQLLEGWYNAPDPANSGNGATRYDGFNYDAMGNRAGSNYVANHGAMTFTRKDNGLNQYRAWWPYSIVNYDDDIGGSWGNPGAANGVIMQDGNITAGYNALNQPMLATSNALAPNWMFFGYDPLGRCVKRWIGALDGNRPPPGIPAPDSGPATYLYYDGWSLIQDGPNASVISAAYILGNRLDEIVADFSMSNYQWLVHHSDARGHCTMLTDWGGNIVEQYEYDAFGLPYFFNSTGQQLNSSNYGNRFLFTGREWLSDLHLYDYRNRMYQPELGRFLQPDPKEFGAGDYNLYRYCHNDPINKSDPFGFDTTVVWSNEGDRNQHEPVVVKNGIEYTAVTEPALQVTVSPAAANGDVVATVHYIINVRYSDNVGPHNKELQKKEPDHPRELDKWRDEKGKPKTDFLARHDGPLQGKSPEQVKQMVDHTLRNSFNDAIKETKKHDVPGDHIIVHPDGIRY